MPDSQEAGQANDRMEKVLLNAAGRPPEDPDIDRDRQTKVMMCAVDCSNARNICIETLNYCFARFREDPRNFAQPLLIKSLQDCAELCEIATSFLLRRAALTGDILQACIKACDLCIEECRRRDGDKQMRDAVTYLSLCRDACKGLVK